MKKWRVSNWRLLLGSLLAIFGSLIIAMDKFPIIHEWINNCHRFSDIQYAIADLNVSDYVDGNGVKVGSLGFGERGFDELNNIIRINRADIQDRIIAVFQDNTISLGGTPYPILHVGLEGNSKTIPITSGFIFHEWIAKDRERVFLRKGLSCIALGFFFGVIGRLERRKALQQESSVVHSSGDALGKDA